jgi:hypothetical protein
VDKVIRAGDFDKKVLPYILRAKKIAKQTIDDGEIFIHFNDTNFKILPKSYLRKKSNRSVESLLDPFMGIDKKSLAGAMEIHLVAEVGQDKNSLSRQILPAMLALSGYLNPSINSEEDQEDRDNKLKILLRQEKYENGDEILGSAKEIRENLVKANYIEEDKAVYPFIAYRNVTHIIGSYLSQAGINTSLKISAVAEKCYQFENLQGDVPDSVSQLREESRTLQPTMTLGHN